MSKYRSVSFPVWSLFVAAGALLSGSVEGQTFQQVVDLGSGVGSRLTRFDTQSQLSRNLFHSLASTVSWVDGTAGTVYQFAADPDYARVLFSRKW